MGRVPPAMVGRDPILGRYATWFKSKNSHGEIALIEGHRGVGKTSLLKVIGASATSAKWVHIHLEARSDVSFEDLLGDVDLDQLASTASKLFGGSGRFKELSAELKAWGIGVSIGAKRNDPNMPTPSIALSRLAHRCDEAGMGLLLTVDEVQRASRALCQSLGELANRSQPMMHVWAGLPGTRASFQEREVTAVERARDFQLDSVTTEEAKEAVFRPLTEQGIQVPPDVQDRVIDLVAGYPYFAQVFGDELWTAHAAAGSPGVIDGALAEQAIGAAHMTTHRFYEDRLALISPRAFEAVEVLAHAAGSMSSTALAGELGLTAKAFSPRRAELLASGLVTSPRRGLLDLSFPGIRSYLTT